MGSNIDLDFWIESQTMTEKVILDIDDGFEGISTVLRHIIVGTKLLN